jgi:hypothetical protein
MPPPPLFTSLLTTIATTTKNMIISTFPRDRDFFLHKLMFLSGSGQVGREREGEREKVCLMVGLAACVVALVLKGGKTLRYGAYPFFLNWFM